MQYVAERCAIVEIGRRLYQRGLIAGPEGNVSTRVGDRLLCTPSGKCKGFLTADEILLVDMDGRVLEGDGVPTSELHMHLAIYRARPDVAAVVHAHPPHVLSFALTGATPPDGVLSEVELFLGPVVLVPYAVPGTEELGKLVADGLPAPRAVAILQNHGAVTLGPSLELAWQRMEVLEAACRAIWLAGRMGPIQKLPADAVTLLRAKYRF